MSSGAAAMADEIQDDLDCGYAVERHRPTELGNAGVNREEANSNGHGGEDDWHDHFPGGDGQWHPEYGPDQKQSAGFPRIEFTPFVLRPPHLVPRREWLYGRHYIRKYCSATIATGGLGKSSLVLVEAVAAASGRRLLRD